MECKGCSRSFDCDDLKPLVIPCGHSVCQACISDALDHYTSGGVRKRLNCNVLNSKLIGSSYAVGTVPKPGRFSKHSSPTQRPNPSSKSGNLTSRPTKQGNDICQQKLYIKTNSRTA